MISAVPPHQLPLFEGSPPRRGATTVEVQRYLGHEDLPARKELVLNRAQQRGAPPAVLSALDQLPDRRYESMGALSTALARGQ